jgi:uncharacterized OB-fold protein
MSKVLPRPTETSAPYWAGCAEGVLRLQQCNACQQYQFYPRIFCSHCGNNELQWREASGRGRIASYTVVQRGVSKDYPAPYVVILVDLEEGPRMMSSLVETEPDSVAVGASVKVEFAAWSEDTTVPVFRITEEEPQS